MLTVLSVQEAQRRILESIKDGRTAIEAVEVSSSLGRVTAEAVLAPEMLPSFDRSTMDGFALKSSDTFGASESLPALLKIKGEVLMGAGPPGTVEQGEAMGISTGGMLPPGSDSVSMVEYCEIIGDSVAVLRPVAPYENTLREGEDFGRGDLVLSSGHAIRPQDIGVLMALGIAAVNVYARPRVDIISTGDELVYPGGKPAPGQIRDVNGPALAAQVFESGALPHYRGIFADQEEKLQAALLASLEEADIVLISGGSSVGERDVTVRVIDNIPGGEVLFHGISMRPGKPAIYGMSSGKPVYGLSGNPVSAMFSFLLFVKPVLRSLQGLPPFAPFVPYIDALLDSNFSSPGGREDYVRVALLRDEDAPAGEGAARARPVYGGPGLLNTMVKADGFFIIPRDVEGLPAGSPVKVYLF